MHIKSFTFFKELICISTFLTSLFASAQSKPGGTSFNVELWLKADAIEATNNEYVRFWQDFSGYNRHFEQYIQITNPGTDNETETAHPVPYLLDNVMNYNPAIYIDNVAQTKLVGPVNIVNANRAYYIYYVSEQKVTGRGSVFSTNASTSTSDTPRNSFGWRDFNPSFYSSTERVASNGIGKPFSINTAYFPNNGTSTGLTVSSRLYVNGIDNSFSGYNLLTSTENIMAIGTSNLLVANPFIGSISEIIILSTTKGSAPDLMDLQKVNSYLSIKYGITLPTAEQVNYFDSSGTIIWNRGDNINYQTSIFGIGRDDTSGLYQKQSTDYEDESITIFLGDLKTTNKENTSIITDDKNFLIFGDNLIKTDTEYNYNSSTQFKNGTLPNIINRRINRILKVTETGEIPFFNMKVKGELEGYTYLLVSETENFTPATTSIYPINDNNEIRDIASDGAYISFATYRANFTEGDFKTELWLNANNIEQPNGTKINKWYDLSGNANNVERNGTNEIPILVKEGINYNSTLKFGNTNTTKLIGNSISQAGRSYYVFYVAENLSDQNNISSTSNYGAIFSFKGNGIDWNTGIVNYYNWLRTGSDMYPNTANFRTNNTTRAMVSTAYFPNNTTNALGRTSIFTNGMQVTYTGNNTNISIATSDKIVIGAQQLTNNYPFIGNISEVIILSTENTKALSLSQVQKVNSYLALKYGITLQSKAVSPVVSAQENYYDSDGNIIWDGVYNTGYQENIFAIGRDDRSGLYQKQATSYDYNSVTAYLGQLKNTNNENTAEISTDKSFLIFGSNRLTGAQSYSHPIGTTFKNSTQNSIVFNQRFNRILKVKKTAGSIGAVSLKLSNELIYTPYILVTNNNTNFTPSNTDLYPVVNGIVENITLNDNDYISFISIPKKPGGSTLDVDFWLSADNIPLSDGTTINTWYDQSTNARNFSQDIDGIAPNLSNKGMNYNPTLSFIGNTTKLVGLPNIINPNKEYYIYYISETKSTGLSTVLAFNQAAANSYGWNGNAPWINPGTARTATNGIGKNYSVNSVYLPNNGTNGSNYLFVNGVSNSWAGSNLATSNTNLMTIGTDNLSSGNPFIGDISEIIVLSRDKTLNTTSILYSEDLNKVNSYLALKYGISLNTTSQANYYNSNGDIIWNANENLGYQTDIFGIGRDSYTNFYQKQATSHNDNSFTIFLNELKETNQENTGTIANDRNYLIVGSNGVTNNASYDVPANTTFNNGFIIPKLISQRHGRVYKVSKKDYNSIPNSITSVNIKTGKNLTNVAYTIVSKTVDFTPNTTEIYPVNNGIATNVELNDGDYIGFVLKDNLPGGIIGLNTEYWLVADDISNSINDGENVTKWINKVNNTNNFIQVTEDAYVPLFAKSAMNYHSSIDFAKIDVEDGGPPIDGANNQRKLISEQDFTPSTSKSYYIITVSRIDDEDVTLYNTLLSLNTNNTYGWYKPSSNTSVPWFQTNDTNYTSAITNESRTYGVTITMLPNTATQSLILNGAQPSTQATRALGVTSSKSILGSESFTATGTTNYFRGEIMEVLVLSKENAGLSLSADELNRINTYYAIKYGISLNPNQTKYVLSDNSTIIYDLTDDNYTEYNKDIFGIVRDDEGSLYQKQSQPIESNVLTVFQGSLAETNEENTGTLENKQAIVFGAKGTLETLVPYSRDSRSESFKNYSLQGDEKLSFRYDYVIKAKVTNGTDNGIDLMNSIATNINANRGQWILKSKNPTFPNSETYIYKITGDDIDITIDDGDYIGFASYMQAPGNISNKLRMWLNASESSTIKTENINGVDEIQSWVDYAGFGTTYFKRVANNSSAVYLKADERTNFHPTAYFRKWQDYLITDSSPMNTVAPIQSSVYSVVNHNFATDRSYFIGFGAQRVQTNARRPSFGVYRSGTGGRGRIGSTSLTNSNRSLFQPGATTIAGFVWNLGTSITFEFDNNLETRNHRAKKAVMNGPGMLGLASSSTSYYLQGTMPEVIVYETELTKEERKRVNTYLGLKYAITLRSYDSSNSTTGNFNYQLTDQEETSIWNGDNNTFSPFHNNVAAIVRDDDTKLYNKQAKSTDIGDVIHMGVGKSLGVNGDLGTITNNYSALVWGTNNEPFSTYPFGDNQAICGKMDSRIGGKIWLVNPTNFDQEVILRAAQGSTFPYNGPGYQVFLLIADEADKLSTANNSWDQIIPMTYVDGGHQVNYKFDPTKVTYFTFGAKATGSCESCDFTGEKKLEFTKTTWPTRGDITPHQFSLGDNFNVEVSIEGATNEFRNRYPRYSSRKSLRERRRGKEEITTVIKFFDNEGNKEAVATYFDLLDIDRVGYKRDDVQIIGYCGDSPIYPTLGYSYSKPERSRYLIGFDGKAVGKAPGIKYSGNSGYTNARALAYVEFENPVDRIEIKYKTESARSTNNTQEIGIGSMTFYCIAPPPPPNEDGLIFTKQASSKVLLCETVDYSFRIINTNCNEKEFTFEDILPKGMQWVEDSFTVNDPNLIIDPENPDATPLSYTDLQIDNVIIEGEVRQKLTVSGLKAPGGGSTYTLRAKAYFDFPDSETGLGGAQAGDYFNRASIEYGQNEKLYSTDRLTGNESSKTEALPSDRPKLIETKFKVDKTCYSLDKEITVTLEINNPNPSSTIFNDMTLDFDYDFSGVNYVSGSLVIPNTISNRNVYLEDGNISIEDFILPSGLTKISLKFKTLENLSDYYFDVNTLEPIALSFSFDLSSESENTCLGTSTINASDEKELEFCTYCTKPSVGGDALNSDTGISTLKSKFSNWPSEVPNGFLVLESGKKGMVITRTRPEDIATPVKGMIIYNTVSKCISIYNGSQWKCIERACNE